MRTFTDQNKSNVSALQFTGDNRGDVLGLAHPDLSDDAKHAADLMRLPVVVTTAEGDITVGESDWVVRDSEDSVRVVAHGSFVENFKEVLS